MNILLIGPIHKIIPFKPGSGQKTAYVLPSEALPDRLREVGLKGLPHLIFSCWRSLGRRAAGTPIVADLCRSFLERL